MSEPHHVISSHLINIRGAQIRSSRVDSSRVFYPKGVYLSQNPAGMRPSIPGSGHPNMHCKTLGSLPSVHL